MNAKKFDELLSNYNSKLNKISKTDIDYKIKINHSALIFFEEINKLDKAYLSYFFNNLDKENIKKNEVHKDALNYLILLVIKNTSITDLFVRFFPEYLEIEFVQKSNWAIVRWLQIFISWIIKPKTKLCNLIDAKRTLNAFRDIKERIGNMHNDLLNVHSELVNYNALSLIIEKISEKEIISLVYRPINENYLLEAWESSYKKNLYFRNNISDVHKELLAIDILLKYFNHRIKLIYKSDEKEILLNKLTILKALFFNEEFSVLEEKINEIRKLIKNNSAHQNATKLSGIYNLIEGIKQRFKSIYEVKTDVNLVDSPHLTSYFKQLLDLTVDKIQFYYEFYRENLDKQYEFCFENGTNFYNILNHLESIIYVDKNLFISTLNRGFDATAFTRLSVTLNSLQKYAKNLETCAKNIDPNSLKSDMIKLSQFILGEVSFLHNELEKEIMAINFSMSYSVDEEEAWDTEWEDVSDASEISFVEQLEQEESFNRDNSFITSIDNQSDSGISYEEISNLDQHLRSIQPFIATPFWHDPNRPVDQFRHCASVACDDNPVKWASPYHPHAITA